MKKLLLALIALALVAPLSADAQTFSLGGYQVTGGAVNRKDSDRWPDYGVNIVEQGADPTGVNDSTAAIQKAFDLASANQQTGNGNRLVYCPGGEYTVQPLLFLDTPGNLRGADGTNGVAYNAGTTYPQGATVNSLGIPYISLQNGNIGHTPASNPTFWQLFNYSAATTYASGAIVAFSPITGLPPVPWISLQNSNTNHTPALGSAFWKPTQTFPQIFGTNFSFVGENGTNFPAIVGGCTLNFQSNNNTALWLGTSAGTMLKYISIHGPGGGHNGNQDPNGVGVGIAGGNAGSNYTTIDHVAINSFYTGIGTEYNNFQTGFGAENVLNRINVTNCYNGFWNTGGDSFINSVYDSDFVCTRGISEFGHGTTVHGGNWGNGDGNTNSFGISSTSALVAAQDSSTANFYYTFSTTIASPDSSITSCPTNNGWCIYNAWMIITPDFGIVPLVMSAYNSSTHVATFITLHDWALNLQQTNLTSNSFFQTEIQAATTIYAAERGTTFWLAESDFSAEGGWIEMSGACYGLTDAILGPGDQGASPSTIGSSGGGGGGVFSNIHWNGYPNSGGLGVIHQYCMDSFPFIANAAPGATTQLKNSFLSNGSNTPGSGNGPVIMSMWPQAGIRFSNNQAGGFNKHFSKATNWNFSADGGLYYVDDIAPDDQVNTNGWPQNVMAAAGQSVGYFPALGTTPRVSSSTYGFWLNPVGAGGLGNYPPVNGGTIYSVLDWGVQSPQYGKFVQSAHANYSYGVNLTTTNIPGLSIAWSGGGIAVRADSGTLGKMFPGLGVDINNGSGDVHYVVTGVVPNNSIDGGTHHGYFTVRRSVDSNPQTLTGAAGSPFTATQIDQDAFNFGTIGLWGSSSIPAASSCGTSPAVTAGSTSTGGSFTTGTASPTACTITFATAFPNTASCTVTPANSAANGVSGGTYVSAQSASAFTVTLGTGTNGAKYNYTCAGT